MRASTSAFLLVGLAAQSATAASWSLTDTIGANDFMSKFDWYTRQDPTNGLVLYQSLANAQAANLSSVTNGQFIMSVDTVEVAAEGRRSIRISSSKSYSDGVYVLRASHVPTGCATWPAFWTVTEDYDSGAWPTGGEIDIVENANDQFPGALSSLHTKSSCTIAQQISSQSGTVQFTNCSAYTPDNSGCRVELDSSPTPSYGSALNAAGGGTYAMERSMGSTGNGVRVWFWANGKEPSDLASGSQAVDPSSWGTPGADFDVADNCHGDFGPHKIVFDITLCGDWAANTYNASGCNAQYPFCAYQVGHNGSSFNQAYWAINDLRVFASGGDTDNAANSPNTHSSSSSSTSAARRSSNSAFFSAVPLQLASLVAASLTVVVSLVIA